MPLPTRLEPRCLLPREGRSRLIRLSADRRHLLLVAQFDTGAGVGGGRRGKHPGDHRLDQGRSRRNVADELQRPGAAHVADRHDLPWRHRLPLRLAGRVSDGHHPRPGGQAGRGRDATRRRGAAYVDYGGRHHPAAGLQLQCGRAQAHDSIVVHQHFRSEFGAVLAAGADTGRSRLYSGLASEAAGRREGPSMKKSWLFAALGAVGGFMVGGPIGAGAGAIAGAWVSKKV